jgi:hypothetical protein
MLVQVIGAFLGIVFVFLAMKDYEGTLSLFEEFSPMQILDYMTTQKNLTAHYDGLEKKGRVLGNLT